MMKANGDKRSTSEILLDLLRQHRRDRITIQEVIDALGERGFGFVLLIFSLPAVLPVPPPLGSLLGIPLMIFAGQMILRRKSPWLPKTVGGRSLVRGDLERIVERGAPMVKRIEKWCRPRLLFLVGGMGERLLGLLVFILALVIALPGPLTNVAPGIAIAFLSVAIIERDGWLVLLGVVGSAAALAIGIAGLVFFFRDMVPWMYDMAWNAWHSLF
jgi:hypothetical protein